MYNSRFLVKWLDKRLYFIHLHVAREAAQKCDATNLKIAVIYFENWLPFNLFSESFVYYQTISMHLIIELYGIKNRNTYLRSWIVWVYLFLINFTKGGGGLYQMYYFPY